MLENGGCELWRAWDQGKYNYSRVGCHDHLLAKEAGTVNNKIKTCDCRFIAQLCMGVWADGLFHHQLFVWKRRKVRKVRFSFVPSKPQSNWTTNRWHITQMLPEILIIATSKVILILTLPLGRAVIRGQPANCKSALNLHVQKPRNPVSNQVPR